MRELDGMYTSKQVAMSVYSQKAQEVMRRPIDSKFGMLLTYRFESCFCDVYFS